MKATLEFNIEDPDEHRLHELCVKSLQMGIVLWEIQYNMRRRLENARDPIETFYDWFNEEMIDRGINLDKLIV